MSGRVHLRTDTGIACPVERSKRWQSVVVSSSRSHRVVTCKGCLRLAPLHAAIDEYKRTAAATVREVTESLKTSVSIPRSSRALVIW